MKNALMKSTLLKLGIVMLVILSIVATVVLVRLGLAALQVARTPTPTEPISAGELGSTASLTILPLYEEAVGGSGYVGGHGVSYLVRTDEQTILTDLGNNPEQRQRAPVVVNMAQAGITPDEIDLLFISHNHPDHTGGLQPRATDFDTAGGQSLLDVDAAFVPVEMAFADVETHVAEAPQVIAPGVATLGRMPFVQPFPFWLWQPLGYEQALAVNVEGKGLVLISGCGHPTLEKMAARAEALFDAPVVGIAGGLHYEGLAAEDLTPHVQFLALRDTQLVALSPHDSGPQAIQFFEQAFPTFYRHMAVGETIRFGAPLVSAGQ